MYKLDLPIDNKEAASIERRRNQEKQRQSRVFNAKTRLIGIDLDALEAQSRDRKQMEQMEKGRDDAYANDMIRNDKIAQLLEKRRSHDARELQRALNEFRALHQQPDARREFDLYDGDYLKKDKPARVSDDDPRCGPASLQKFDGEDLNNKARTQFQQEQLREWSEAQAREKAQARDNQAQADRMYDLKTKELDIRAQDLQAAEEGCRRAINQATSDYNNALSRENQARRDRGAKQEADDNATELANHIFGDVLTENPAVAQSAFGPHRVIPDRWKGMSPEQLEEIRRTQEQQRLEAERAAEAERQRQAEHEAQAQAHARAGLLMEREVARRESALRRQLADENKKLGEEQRSNKEYLNKQVYTNEPASAFFQQFNTSSR